MIRWMHPRRRGVERRRPVGGGGRRRTRWRRGPGRFAVLMSVAVCVVALVSINGCKESEPEEETRTPQPARTTESKPDAKRAVETPPDQSEDSIPEPAQSSGAAMKTYVDETYGFTIGFPIDWDYEKELKPAAVQAVSRKEHVMDAFGENAYVTVSRTPEGATLENLIDIWRIHDLASTPDGVEHEMGEFVVDGHRCVWVTAAYTIDAVKCKAVHYFFLADRTGFRITCTATPESFAKYRNTFQEIATSFRPD